MVQSFSGTPLGSNATTSATTPSTTAQLLDPLSPGNLKFVFDEGYHYPMRSTRPIQTAGLPRRRRAVAAHLGQTTA